MVQARHVQPPRGWELSATVIPPMRELSPLSVIPPSISFQCEGCFSAQAGIYAPMHPRLRLVFLHVRGIPLIATRQMRAATEAR